MIGNERLAATAAATSNEHRGSGNRLHNGLNNRVNPVEAAQENKPASIKAAMEQIDQVKDALRDVVGFLNDAMKTLGQVQREHRTAEKEVDSIRDSLRSLQKVKL